jgi:hypothetical protein
MICYDRRTRQSRQGEERSREVNEASLAVARKVVLCAGLLASALLLLYPKWKVNVVYSEFNFDYDMGRCFIMSPPVLLPSQLAKMMDMGTNNNTQAIVPSYISYQIIYVRQLTEVVLALLFTFGLVRALRKPVGD